MSEDITSLRVHVHGFVQGVGFRDFLAMSAQHNKLDGWVRANLKSGELNTIYKQFHGVDLPQEVGKAGG